MMVWGAPIVVGLVAQWAWSRFGPQQGQAPAQQGRQQVGGPTHNIPGVEPNLDAQTARGLQQALMSAGPEVLDQFEVEFLRAQCQGAAKACRDRSDVLKREALTQKRIDEAVEAGIKKFAAAIQQPAAAPAATAKPAVAPVNGAKVPVVPPIANDEDLLKASAQLGKNGA